MSEVDIPPTFHRSRQEFREDLESWQAELRRYIAQYGHGLAVSGVNPHAAEWQGGTYALFISRLPVLFSEDFSLEIEWVLRVLYPEIPLCSHCWRLHPPSEDTLRHGRYWITERQWEMRKRWFSLSWKQVAVAVRSGHARPCLIRSPRHQLSSLRQGCSDRALFSLSDKAAQTEPCSLSDKACQTEPDDELETLKGRVKGHEEKNKVLDQEIIRLKAVVKNHEETNEALKQTNEALKQTNNGLDARNKALNGTITDLKKDNKDRKEVNEALDEMIKDLEKRNEELESRNEDLDRKLSNADVDIARLEKDNASLRVENRRLAPGATIERQAKRQYEDTIRGLESDKSWLETEKQQLLQSRDGMEQRCVALSQDSRDWASKNVDLRFKITQLETSVKIYKSSVEEGEARHARRIAEKEKEIAEKEKEMAEMGRDLDRESRRVIQLRETVGHIRQQREERDATIQRLKTESVRDLASLRAELEGKMQEVEGEMREVEAKLQRALTSVASYRDEVRRKDAELERLREEELRAEILAEDLEEVREDLKDVREERDELEEEGTELKTTLQALQGRYLRLSRAASLEREWAASLERDREPLVQQRDTARGELYTARQELTTVRGQLRTSAASRTKAERERDALQKESDALREELRTSAASRTKAERERDALQKERDALEKERDALQEEREAIRAERNATRADLEAVRARRAIANARFFCHAALRTKFERERDTIQADLEAVRAERDTIRADRQRLATRCTALEAERSGAKAALSLVMHSRLEQGNARLRYLKARLEDAERRVLLLQGEANLQTAAAERHGNTIAARQNTITELEKKAEDGDREVKRLQEKVEELQKTVKDGDREVERLKKQVEDVQKKAEDGDREVKRLQEKVIDCNREVEKAEKEAGKLRNDNGKQVRAIWTKTQEMEQIASNLKKVQQEKQTSAEALQTSAEALRSKTEEAEQLTEALRKKTEEAEKLTNDVKKVQTEKDALVEAIRHPGAPPSQQLRELEQLRKEVRLMRENTVVRDELFDVPDEMFTWDDAPWALMSHHALCEEDYERTPNDAEARKKLLLCVGRLVHERARVTDLEGNPIATNLLKLGIRTLYSWANDHAETTDPKEVAIWLNLWRLVVKSRALYVEELPKKTPRRH